MPLTKEQSEILQVIAANRNPDSVIAGGIPLARIGPRYSHDVDIFHDRASRLVEATTADIAALEHAGFTVDITLVSSASGVPTDVTCQRAEVARGGLKTTLEWAVDSDFRYFPTIPDPEFGYVLNPGIVSRV